MIDNLLKMLEQGQDSAMLRFTLGTAYLKQDEPDEAVMHLREAVRQDEGYSAAWKALGQALDQAGWPHEALEAFDHGMQAAQAGGDMQVLKELQVFRRRLEKRLSGDA